MFTLKIYKLHTLSFFQIENQVLNQNPEASALIDTVRVAAAPNGILFLLSRFQQAAGGLRSTGATGSKLHVTGGARRCSSVQQRPKATAPVTMLGPRLP